MVDLYAKADTPALREAALQGLLISDDVDAVTKLYRNARGAKEKKALLQVLTAMDDDSVIDLIEQELDESEKQR